jgi:hypothetical protein
MHIVSIPGLWGQFLHGLFFKKIYVTLIISSNKPGDVSFRPLLPRLFWCHFLPPKFLAWRHIKVAIYYVSLSLPLSTLRQQSCLKAQTTEQWSSHAQGACIAQNCHVLTNWNWGTTQENLHRVFYNCPYFLVSNLWYTCMLAFASRLGARCVVNLVFQVIGCQFFQWEDMMEKMPPIPLVS